MAETPQYAWGAKAIAREINKTPRATFHLLEKGQIPGSRKIGEQWVLDVQKFRDSFKETAA